MVLLQRYIYNLRSNVSSKVYCFEKNKIVHSFATSFLVNKNFVHLNQLNEFIQHAIAGGLIEKFHVPDKIRPIRRYKERTFEQISLEHFYGLFFLTFIQLSVSLICLILETIVYKKVNEPNRSRFWKMAEMFIDPKRYFMLNDKLV